MTDQLTPLELPVPPLWGRTLGYRGDALLVALEGQEQGASAWLELHRA